MKYIFPITIFVFLAGCGVPTSTRMVSLGIYQDLLSTIYYKEMNYNLGDYYPETTVYCVDVNRSNDCLPIKVLYKVDNEGIRLNFVYKNEIGIYKFEEAIKRFIDKPIDIYRLYKPNKVDIIEARVKLGRRYDSLSLKTQAGYGPDYGDTHYWTVRYLLSKIEKASYKIEEKGTYRRFKVTR